MKRWKKVLGDMRVLGPDVQSFREDVMYLYIFIERLEQTVDALERALAECHEHAGEGE